MSEQDDYTLGELARTLKRVDVNVNEMRFEAREDREKLGTMQVDHAAMRERLIALERDVKGLRSDMLTRGRHDLFASFSAKRAGWMVGFLFSLFEFAHLALEKALALTKGHQ